MTERNANLLLSDAVAPANGFQYPNVIQWPGGPFSATVTGVIDTAHIDIYVSTKYPAEGKLYADDDLAKATPLMVDADWVLLNSFTANGMYNLVNLNPCLIIVKVSSVGVNTRSRCVIG